MTPDEAHQEGGAGAGPARRTGAGPRHAAPKKPLLTRLHVPAGKAIALAAIPSAVLMGMGLTPQLAGAKPLPKNPFKDGPCVSVPDQPGKGAEDTREKAERERTEPGRTEPGQAGESAKPEASPAPEPGAEVPEEPEEPSAGTGSDGADSGAASGSPGSTPAPGATESEPSPAETGKRTNPLDPLGVGDALRDLFTRDDEAGERTARQEPETSPSPSSSPSADSGSGDPVKDTADDTADDIADDTAADTADALAKAGQDLKDGAQGAADRAGDAVEDVAGAADTPRESAEEAVETPAAPGPDATGKEPFPCPTHDAEALANADEERTEALLPDAPWQLKSTLLTLHGLDYQGIVKVRTYSGTVKDVLKFTATSVDIRDLHQLVDGPGSSTAHVRAAKGSTSTIRNGTVTMYTEELKGNLFGLIPITFSPDSPPPLNIPEVFFTDVTVKQAGQFGGTLHIPGMNLYDEG